MSMSSAYLVLEDGTVFDGYAADFTEETIGEVVFNTSMVGYQEMLTDPSYYGQILVFTYPLIGNYGIDPGVVQSSAIQVKGVVVHELCANPSHNSSEMGFAEYAERNGLALVHGVDTRAVTRYLRSRGVMLGALTASDDFESVVEQLRKTANYGEETLIRSSEQAVVGDGDLRIALIDYGVKNRIVDSLTKRGCEVHILPSNCTYEAVKELRPDGVVISPGPGDPVHLDHHQELVKCVIEDELPLMGICLGHQLVARAFGAQTYKLKFGHRGGNQPVLDRAHGKIAITAHNHGYAVERATLNGDLEETHTNINDDTVAGLRHRSKPVFTVQYHPEAAPGPNDSKYLFDEFMDMVRVAKGAANVG